MAHHNMNETTKVVPITKKFVISKLPQLAYAKLTSIWNMGKWNMLNTTGVTTSSKYHDLLSQCSPREALITQNGPFLEIPPGKLFLVNRNFAYI